MMAVKTDMREALLAVGRAAVQARGYSALSFRDLANEVGIKSASVHYYFPTKGDLAAALARRYTEEAVAYLDGVLAGASDPAWCVARYAEIFRSALLNDNRMCLVGMMSAELDELPVEVRKEVDAFAAVNVAWLTRVLALAPKSDATPQAVQDRALAVFAAVQGAQLVARGGNDIAVFDRAITAYRAAGLLP